jgi:hypothetical protein
LVGSTKRSGQWPRAQNLLWEVRVMTISTSINTVGVVRATEMIQSARRDAALQHDPRPHTVSVEISRLSDTLASEQDAGRSGPGSQRRIVDITV